MFEIDFTLIYATVVAAVPTITAVVSFIVMLIKALNGNKDVKNFVTDQMNALKTKVENNTKVKEQYEATQAQVLVVVEENCKLRKQVAELLTEITKIEHKVEELENEQRNEEV